MDANQLVGRHVHVRGADPDFFGVPVAALIRATDPDSQSLLLEFVPPIQIGAQVYPFAVAKPCLERDTLGVLLGSGLLGCAITCVPRDRYNPTKPLDLSWWRGGGAAIADVVL